MLVSADDITTCVLKNDGDKVTYTISVNASYFSRKKVGFLE